MTPPFPRTEQPPARGRGALIFAVYVLLTVLVWGLGVSTRGLWQDDATMLAIAEATRDEGPWRLFHPVAGLNRRFILPVFAAASATPSPVLFLQLAYGAAWIVQGLLVHLLATDLVPGRRFVAFCAGALTLCATSDFLTNSPTSLHYALAACEYLLALHCALRFLRGSAWSSAVLSAVFFAMSLWTVEAAIPAAVLAPVFFWVFCGFRLARPVLVLLVLWGLAAAPYLVVLASVVANPASYAHVALVSPSWSENIRHGFELWLVNFQPWEWALRRPRWMGENIPASYSIAGLFLPVGLGTLAFGFTARTLVDEEPPHAGAAVPRTLWLVGLLLLTAFLTNVCYASVQLWEVHYRTHALSRIWCSLALALAIDRAARRPGVARTLAIAIAGLFVAFGIFGGVERRDFFATSWTGHQRELRSIVEAAPQWKPGTKLVLWSSPSPHFLATEAEYIARCWILLLYGDPALSDSTFLWAAERHAGCVTEEAGWRCWREGQQECFRAGACRGETLPFAETAVLAFDGATGSYALLDTVPAELGGGGRNVDEAYDPASRRIAGPLTERQRRMLLLP